MALAPGKMLRLSLSLSPAPHYCQGASITYPESPAPNTFHPAMAANVIVTLTPPLNPDDDTSGSAALQTAIGFEQ